jgi:hypothetical protein
MPKLDKDTTTEKKITDQLPWTILNTIPSNWIQQHTKKIIHHDQVSFIPDLQGGWFNKHKSINIITHVNWIKYKNHIIISIDA